MRIEGHDARPQPGPPGCVDHAQVAAVDAVEGPDGDRTPRARQLGRLARDVHAPGPARRSSTRSSTSASGSSRSGRERLRRDGVVHRERPDLRPPQRRAVPAERVGDRPHVGPRADAQVERDPLARIRDDVERVHGRAAQPASPPRRRAARACTRAHRRSSPRRRPGSAARSRRGGARAARPSSSSAGGGAGAHDLALRIAGRRPAA